MERAEKVLALATERPRLRKICNGGNTTFSGDGGITSSGLESVVGGTNVGINNSNWED